MKSIAMAGEPYEVLSFTIQECQVQLFNSENTKLYLLHNTMEVKMYNHQG